MTYTYIQNTCDEKKTVSILGLNNEKQLCSFHNDDEDDVTNYNDDDTRTTFLHL